MYTLVTFLYAIFVGLAATHPFEQQVLAAPESHYALKKPSSKHQGTSALSVFPQFRSDGSNFSTGFVAFGDSYSAGIGTAVKGQENDCRQGMHAHAVLIAADLEASQGGQNTTVFQFLSCTGHRTTNVMAGGEQSQIDAFNPSLPADFALLSIGGNDLGFFDVINACVFRFYDLFSGDCEGVLAKSRAMLEGDEFETRLRIVITEILDKARWEKKPWFFITMTGYARFFNELTDECDNLSLGFWWKGPRLTKELRASMNALVLTVNAKLRKTINSINSHYAQDKVVFVDYDGEFEGHRFCEPNVREPDYLRADTWFFLVGGPDNARNGTQLRRLSDVQTLPSTSALIDPLSCLEPARRSGDWGIMALCYMTMAKYRDPTLRPARGDSMSSLGSMWYVPTFYGKTFHPRTLGHETIRNKMYEIWREMDE
jgi:hypothetical protein